MLRGWLGRVSSTRVSHPEMAGLSAMFAFGLLLGLFALLHLPGFARLGFATRREKAAAALAGMFFFTGTLHFATPDRFVAMIPPPLPAPLLLVYISGACELLGAAGLLLRRLRRWAGWGLAALLVAVFPANIYVALSGGSVEGMPENNWYYWLRLPVQFVFIAWALWCSRQHPQPVHSAAAP